MIKDNHTERDIDNGNEKIENEFLKIMDTKNFRENTENIKILNTYCLIPLVLEAIVRRYYFQKANEKNVYQWRRMHLGAKNARHGFFGRLYTFRK